MSQPFDGAAAARMAAELHGLFDVRVQALASYADQNFLLHLPGGERRVLKVAHAGEDRASLSLQNDVMEHLHAAGVPGPRPLPSRTGELIESVVAPGGTRHHVRLVTFLEGRTWASLDARPLPLVSSFGAFLGRLDRALLDFDAPNADRVLPWDLARAPAALAETGIHLDARRRGVVETLLVRLRDELLPYRDDLRPTMIHNDANDHNVLVDQAEATVSALIDFGDVVRAPLLFDPAIALAYLVLDTEEPLAVLQSFLAGYERELPLRDRERAFLPLALAARLAYSVTSSARERALRPDDPYLDVTEPAAWRFLDDLGADTLERWGECLGACEDRRGAR